MSSTRSARFLRGIPAATRAALAAAVLAVAGCGGGGDASAPGAMAPAISDGGAAAPAASFPTCNLADFRAGLLARVNQARARGTTCGSEGAFAPVAAVAWNDALTQAASGHAADMAAHNYFSHTSQDGRTLSQRVDETGYRWSVLGENIAAGQRTVNSVVDAWLASPGHCANIMRPEFTEMGVACVPGPAGNDFGTYWAMELARPR